MVVAQRLSTIGVFAAALLMAACGGNDARSTPSAQTAASTGAAPPQTRPRNACALVDRPQLEAIAGKKLDMLHNIEADDHTICELTATGTTTLLVSVGVHWRGGKELARVNETAMGMARRMLNEPDVDIEKLTGSGNVKGLADKAYYSDVMPSWLLKGDVLIEVLAPQFSHDKTKAVYLSVANSALPRL